MFQPNSFDPILRQKTELQKAVTEQRQLIDTAFEKSDSDGQRASKHLENLQQELGRLRLRGGEFRVYVNGKLRVVEVSGDGQIAICSQTRTNDPTPPNTEKHKFVRVGIEDGGVVVVTPEALAAATTACSPSHIRRSDTRARATVVAQSDFRKAVSHPDYTTKTNNKKKIGNTIDGMNDNTFLIRAAERVDYVDSILSIRRSSNCFWIKWRSGKSTKISGGVDEVDELEEVLGALIRKENQARVFVVQTLQDVWNLTRVPYDSNNEEHENMLMLFWKNVFPGRPLDNRITKMWGEIGFQGKDPATDFRGMGEFGLRQLLFFSEKHADVAQKIIGEKRDYPFAIAGINISSIIVRDLLLLSEQQMQHAPASVAWRTDLFNFLCKVPNVRMALDEVYCLTFRLLDSLWVGMGATYMQFPFVVTRVKKKMHEMLERHASSLSELKAWVDQEILLGYWATNSDDEKEEDNDDFGDVVDQESDSSAACEDGIVERANSDRASSWNPGRVEEHTDDEEEKGQDRQESGNICD